MGSSISSLFTRLFGKKQIRVLMVGLDAVGKTTILYRLKLGVVETQPHPTIGFNVETIQHKNISFTVWDLGGGDKIRALWKHYFRDTEGELKGVIFVIDSKDRNRVDEAAYEIHRMMKEEEFQGAVLLVLANKQDLADAMTVTELTELLRLKELQNCKWHIQGTVGLQGLGLYEGLDWMSNELVPPQ